jgi:hypothetical protein
MERAKSMEKVKSIMLTLGTFVPDFVLEHVYKVGWGVT